MDANGERMFKGAHISIELVILVETKICVKTHVPCKLFVLHRFVFSSIKHGRVVTQGLQVIAETVNLIVEIG